MTANKESLYAIIESMQLEIDRLKTMNKLDNKNLIAFTCDVLRVFDIYADDFADKELLDIGIRIERLYQIASKEAERDARELANKRQSVE